MIYKANIKGLWPPMKINFSNKQGDVMVYISRKHASPSAQNADRVYKDPIHIFIDDKEKFI